MVSESGLVLKLGRHRSYNSVKRFACHAFSRLPEERQTIFFGSHTVLRIKSLIDKVGDELLSYDKYLEAIDALGRLINAVSVKGQPISANKDSQYIMQHIIKDVLCSLIQRENRTTLPEYVRTLALRQSSNAAKIQLIYDELLTEYQWLDCIFKDLSTNTLDIANIALLFDSAERVTFEMGRELFLTAIQCEKLVNDLILISEMCLKPEIRFEWPYAVPKALKDALRQSLSTLSDSNISYETRWSSAIIRCAHEETTSDSMIMLSKIEWLSNNIGSFGSLIPNEKMYELQWNGAMVSETDMLRTKVDKLLKEKANMMREMNTLKKRLALHENVEEVVHDYQPNDQYNMLRNHDSFQLTKVSKSLSPIQHFLILSFTEEHRMATELEKLREWRLSFPKQRIAVQIDSQHGVVMKDCGRVIDLCDDLRRFEGSVLAQNRYRQRAEKMINALLSTPEELEAANSKSIHEIIEELKNTLRSPKDCNFITEKIQNAQNVDDVDAEVTYTLLRDENGKTLLHLSSICDLVSNSSLCAAVNVPREMALIIAEFTVSGMTLKLDTTMVEGISCEPYDAYHDVQNLFDPGNACYSTNGETDCEILIHLSDKNHVKKRGLIGGGDGFVIKDIGLRPPIGGGYTDPVQHMLVWAFYNDDRVQKCVAHIDTKSYEAKYDFFENSMWVKARRILVKLVNPPTLRKLDALQFWMKVVPL